MKEIFADMPAYGWPNRTSPATVETDPNWLVVIIVAVDVVILVAVAIFLIIRFSKRNKRFVSPSQPISGKQEQQVDGTKDNMANSEDQNLNENEKT
jgi:uncharacterized protein YpmS